MQVGPRARALLPAVAAAGLLLSACAPTARTTGPYQAKASTTAEVALSAVGTDLLLVQAIEEHRVFATFASVATSDTEKDLGSAASKFLSIQPPTKAAERVRSKLSDLLDDAQGVVGDVRIAARRGDRAAVLATRADLERSRRALERFTESLQ